MAYPKEVCDTVDELVSSGQWSPKGIQKLMKYKGQLVSLSFVYRRIKKHVANILPPMYLIDPQNPHEAPGVIKWLVDPDTIPDSEKIIGVFSDLHLPAEYPGFMDFVIKTFIARGVNTIVCNGDIFDFHAASRWPSDPEISDNRQEVELIKIKAAPWFVAFPYVMFMEGNHDRIPTRAAKSYGMDDWFIADYYAKLGMPATWKRHLSYTMLNGVEFDHGEGSGGMYGCINTARKRGGSFVQGHCHSYGGVMYRANSRKIYFGANSGCGCDNLHPAMGYASKIPEKGTIGCLIVESDIHADFIPMPIGKKE